MKIKIRYRFWQILVGIIVVGMVGFLLYTLTDHTVTSKRSVEELTKPEPKYKSSPVRPLFVFLYIVTFFYFAINYYYNLVANNKKFFTYVKVTAAIILVAFLYHCFIHYSFPSLLEKKYDTLSGLFRAMIGGTIPMLIVSFVIAYFTVLREALKQRRILEAQKMQLEAQISQANFNFLKAQINPHFLHNTLNFLYAKSLPYSAELSEGILTLSDVMRYALNQGNQRDGKAPLVDEIEHVNNVIKISQLRYNNQLKVNFEVTGAIEGLMIIPFVLITIVENAFKHGDLKNQESPIDIRLNVKRNRLYFFCRNKKKSGPKQLSTGIGLDNIKKRLDLAYGEGYRFAVKDEPEFYTTELIIDNL